ncbi:unnamed protein product [Hymenolepis diminuta]|uniref:Photolyase/cryptochrome alpha/beta domain-containing protein n=2 Tax=Hymenolepis diminuta TaxID=6216 RepID=A0A0R3SUG7_HYMDI|nr:unnamed protein product [Hymenolepis diminuta]
MRVLHWFRKGLRLHDNPALLASLNPPKKTSDEPIEILFLYIYDTTGKEYGMRGYRQAQFLLESLVDLDQSLKKLGKNLRLLVVEGDPIMEVPALCKNLDVKYVTFEADIEPYSIVRDNEVTKKLEEEGVTVSRTHGHTMWDPEFLKSHHQPPQTATKDSNSKNLGIPMTYQSFCALIRRVSPQGPSKPLPSFEEYAKSCTAPNLSELELGKVHIGPPSSLEQLKIEFDPIPELGDHVSDDEGEKWEMTFPGGEIEGLDRLQRMVAQRPDWVCSFAKPETAPTSLPISTTGLSPYIRFGCVSARHAWWVIAEAMRPASKASKTKPPTQPPVSLHGQLLWREFFNLVASVTPNFDRIEGNPICRPIDWNVDENLLSAWREARTGFPFIDAAMIQLHRHGWMHHLARHAVACFLTRGQLWQSWTAGADIFSSLLLDADWALNSANWMWLSASAFFHQYYRIYCPVSFGRKTDQDGEFIRHFIPALRNMPPEYIYDPWTAPMSVQKKAGCIIGVDYPDPIVDHQEAKAENLERMKAAYADREVSPTPEQKRKITFGFGKAAMKNAKKMKK